jgi:multidrug efflux pump subunit AcrA (membrane-fusion protein)
MSSRTLALALLLGGLTPLAACGGKAGDGDPRTQAPLVRVAVANPMAGAERRFSGVVSARVQSDLGFRVGGKVMALVDAGQTVRRGQPLMRIDATDYALAVSAQTEQVEAARARAVQTASDERRYRGLVVGGRGLRPRLRPGQGRRRRRQGSAPAPPRPRRASRATPPAMRS